MINWAPAGGFPAPPGPAVLAGMSQRGSPSLADASRPGKLTPCGVLGEGTRCRLRLAPLTPHPGFPFDVGRPRQRPQRSKSKTMLALGSLHIPSLHPPTYSTLPLSGLEGIYCRGAQKGRGTVPRPPIPAGPPAQKDTDKYANTFNALRIHGRKKRFSDSQKYYKSHVQAKHTQHRNNNVGIYIRN